MEQQNVWLIISFIFFKWPAVPGKSVLCLRGSSGPEHLWARCPSVSYRLALVCCKLSLSLGEQEVRYLLPNVYIFTVFVLNQQILPQFLSTASLVEAQPASCWKQRDTAAGGEALGWKPKPNPGNFWQGKSYLPFSLPRTLPAYFSLLFIPFSGLRAPSTVLFWFSFRLEWQRLISMWGSCWMCGCRSDSVPCLCALPGGCVT